MSHEGRYVVELVAILDDNTKNVEGYRQMLEASREELEYRFFHRPEDVVRFVKNNPVAVLVSELEMPHMSGKELFDIVGMASPSTVRIGMAQADDIAKTLEIFNQAWMYRLILKPFFLPEDLVGPIQEGLVRYRALQEGKKRKKGMEDKLEELSRRMAEVSAELARKKRRHVGIYNVALGIVKGNLSPETSRLGPEAGSDMEGLCEELLEDFMRCYMYENYGFQYYAQIIQEKFHHPESGCILQVKNKTGHTIPEELMPKIAFGMFLGGLLCQNLFVSYRVAMLVEQEGRNCLLRIFCQYPEHGKVYRTADVKARRMVVNMVKEIAREVSTHMVLGTKNREFAMKLYFGKEEERHERNHHGPL